MGTHDREARSVTGDPAKLSKANREAGHADLVKSMSEREALLTKASGTVSDHRILVAFVYLLLRHDMPFGLMDAIVRKSVDARREGVGALYRFVDKGLTSEQAERLAGRPSVCVRDWLADIYLSTSNPTQIDTLFDSLPESSDTEIVFTNGWIAGYAKYVADELLAEDVDACS